MWIASTLGWFSVVVDTQRPGRLLVRARCKADIDGLYEMAKDLASIEKPTSDPLRDYRHRLSCDREDWLRIAVRLADGVTYSNFKSEVAKQESQQNKYAAYHQVWATLARLQADENPRRVEPDDGIPWKFPTTIDEPDKPAKQPVKRKTAKKAKKLW